MVEVKFMVTFLTIFTISSLLPVLIISFSDGIHIWGERDKLQKNLQRCHPKIDDCQLTHWCELIQLEKGVRSPFTSYTNILFMIFGCWIITSTYYFKRDEDTIQNHLKTYPLLGYQYGLVFWWCGITSFICHASGLPLSRELDRSGIWAIILYPCFIALIRFPLPPLKKISYFLVWLTFIIIWLSLTLYHIFYGNQENEQGNKEATQLLYQSIPWIVVCLIVFIYLEESVRKCFQKSLQYCLPFDIKMIEVLTLKTNHILAVFALLFGILGYFLQNPERIGLECIPTNPWYLQTHGYWHLSIAIAMYILWWMYWTDEVVSVIN